ncbi:hypothetical protein GCM10027293_19100 [Pontibacter aydingkolensis]
MMMFLLQLCSHIVICALPFQATAGANHSASNPRQNITVVAEQEPQTYSQIYFQNGQTEEETEEETEESRLYTNQDHFLAFVQASSIGLTVSQFLASAYHSIAYGIEPDPPQIA